MNSAKLLEQAWRNIREGNRSEAGLKIDKLAGDASLRQYFRVHSGKSTHVLMLTEPFSLEESSFLLVRDLLERHKVACPRLEAVDGEKGAVLLEDLGDFTMLHALAKDGREEQELLLFHQAIDLLVDFHKNLQVSPDEAAKVPGYALAFDEEKLMWEVDLTLEHLFRSYLQRTISPAEHRAIRDAFADICKRLAAEPRVFTHRDYHSRNIMIGPNGRMACIDFQDARMGLRQYDLASILRDSYYQLSEDRVYTLVDYYLDAVERREKVQLDRRHFIQLFDLMSVQRNFKAIGSFTMFYAKRNDAMYLRFVGNTFENIRRNLLKFEEYTDLRKALFRFYYF